MRPDLNRDGTRPGRPVVTPDPPEVDTPKVPPVFHVWVNLSNLSTHESTEYPGLVLAWRRGLERWEAYVIYVIPNPDGSPTAFNTWVDARRLKPVQHR